MAVMTKSPAGEDIVILSRAEYDALLEAAENASDAAAFARAKAETGGEFLTSEEMEELLAARTPLAFWRCKRGLRQGELAARAGIGQSYVSALEGGTKKGDVTTLAKLAEALQVRIEDLIDDR